MKNSVTAILLSLTLIFAAFVGGVYVGRNTNRPDIEVSGFATTTAPASQATPTTQTSPSPTSGTSTPTTIPATDPSATEPTAPATDPSAAEPTAPATDPSATEPTAPEVTFPININTATLEELDLLPGIGPVLAQRILDYRAEIGRFTSVEELLDVKGIGEKTLEKLLEYITV